MKLKLSIGQQIAHKKYGAGTVCDVPDGPKSKEIQIRFWIDDGKSEVRWLKNSSRQIRVVRKPQFTVKSKLKKFKSDIVWFIQQILSRKPTKIAKIYDQIITYWTFAAAFKSIQKYMHESSKNKGFWEPKHKSLWYKVKVFFGWKQKDVSDNRNMCEEIALMHSELSEAVEALRDGNPKSKKIPEYSCVEEELADVILRIMDFAEGHHLDVTGAIVAKDKYNYSRPYKHGRKF